MDIDIDSKPTPTTKKSDNKDKEKEKKDDKKVTNSGYKIEIVFLEMFTICLVMLAVF
jgi:hypothetical protein